MEHFHSPNSSGDLRSDAHQSQIIGGDTDVDHTQIIGGIYPPSPRVLAPLAARQSLGEKFCQGVQRPKISIWVTLEIK